MDDLEKDLKELEENIKIVKNKDKITTNNKKKIKIIENINNSKLKIVEDNNDTKLNVKKNIIVPSEIDLKNIDFQKPFLKWVGGKTQILSEILKKFPTEINTYHEIFLGGGSVLLGILTLVNENIINIKEIYAYDINKPLIYLYKNIQTKVNEFIKEITKIVDEYNNVTGEIINRKPKNINEAKTSQESYYYWIRQQYNKLNENEKTTVIGSAYFLFLNKTCFRGIFRLGPNGFNVPYGHYKNPAIFSTENIKTISKLIKNVNFINSSFEQSLLNVKKNDMIYLDPPYVPLNATSFVGYTADGFEGTMHKKLFEMLEELKNKNINWMMSNSDTTLVLDSFKDIKKYIIEKILCRRAIHSKKPESKTNEVIIKSFY
jgi:DNA adenine methylase